MEWYDAQDIKDMIEDIVPKLPMGYVNTKLLVCFRSKGSNSNARARIWSLPRVWQQALEVEPHYIIEVLSEKFDHLSLEDKKRVIIHELMHIPKSFSGSLVPHRGRGRHIVPREVEKLYSIYKGEKPEKKINIKKFFHL